MKIRFPERGRSGRFVATIKNLEFGFGDKVGGHTLLIIRSATLNSSSANFTFC